MKVFSTLSLLLMSGAVNSWSPNGPTQPPCRYRHETHVPPKMILDRRGFLSTAIGWTSLPLGWLLTPRPASSAPSGAVLDDKFGVEDAKKRFPLARQEMQYLLDHYSAISQKGGGNAVRNYLGTQGVTSNMYGIQKVLKLLQAEAADMVEYTETMEDFNANYYQAEGAAYQSMFAEFSSARTTPEALLATAKKDIETMVKYMDQLALQLNL